jgi:hypothetical protein
VEEERDFKAKCAWHNLPGVFCRAGFAGRRSADLAFCFVSAVSFENSEIILSFITQACEVQQCDL